MYKIFFVPEGKYIALIGGHKASMDLFTLLSWANNPDMPPRYDCQNKRVLAQGPMTFDTYWECKKIIKEILSTNFWLLLYNNPNYYVLREGNDVFLVYKSFLPEYFEIVEISDV